MVFVLVQKNQFEPMPVQYVIENSETGEQLDPKLFTIKHVADWAETAVDDYVNVTTKFKQIQSLQKKSKKKPTEAESIENMRVSSAFFRLIVENGIVESEGIEVWKKLSIPMKTELCEAYMKWVSEVSKESK
jgi:hypothetical protein